MGCFNILFIALIALIYFSEDLRPMMDLEGFWFTVLIIWGIFFLSFLLVGDIADKISGVDDYEDY